VGNINFKKHVTSVLCVALLLSSMVNVGAFAADISLSFTAPNDGSSYTFSVPIQVNETEPYAGIQFKLEFSSGEYLSYAFELSSAASARGAIKYAPLANSSHFGFWCGTNAFSGDLLVGALNITYTGDAPQAVSIAEMMVVRIDESTKTSYGAVTPPPIGTISVSRADSAAYYTVIFDLNGGSRTGGGELVQTVLEGGAAAAPMAERSGFTFDGWDRAFGNVTSDMTVTARWAPNVIEKVPITFIQINAPVAATVVRGGTYAFGVTLNEGAVDDDIMWSVNNPSYATVSNGRTVNILNRTGTVILTAKDPASSLSHSIVLRIV